MAITNHQQRIVIRIGIVTALLLIATLLAALAMHFWVFELLAHFMPFYAAAALVCAIILGLMGAWRWMLLAIALALWNGYAPARVLLADAPPAKPLPRAGQFTLFHFNVNRANETPSRVVSYLQRHAKAIDVVVLLEINSDFDVALEDIREQFPYQIKHLEDSPFGIALASRLPIEPGTVAFIPTEAFPHVEATLKLPARTRPLALYGLHAPPPLSAEYAAARNAKLEHVARLAAAQPDATPVVVGDFNVTPWSPYFKHFIDSSGLRDTRAPNRLDPTWPVLFGSARLGLAIDHSFAHPSLRVVKRTVGPDLGSDHLPVTVTLAYGPSP